MNIKELGSLLKDILFLEETKNFKTGEILKAEVLEKKSNFLIIKIENKGILKALTEVPVNSKKIILKVLKNTPKPVLKIISELKDEKNFDKIQKIIKDFEINKKIINFIKKNYPEIIVSTEDLKKNPENFKKIIDKEGISHEYKISKNEFTENLKSTAIIKNEHQILNFIENFQFICNENFLLFPVFFKHEEFKKAIIGLKKNKSNFSVLIIINFPEMEKLKIFINQISKSLFINFSSNSKKFLEKIKENINALKNSIENITDYKIKSINFSIENDLNENFEILEFSQIVTNDNLVNIKA